MTHPWKSTDEKRTIVFSYSPGNNIIKYLNDMRDLINRAIINAHVQEAPNITWAINTPMPPITDTDRATRKISRTISRSSVLMAGWSGWCCGMSTSGFSKRGCENGNSQV